MNTILGIKIEPPLLENYLHALIGQFFKILPFREDDVPTLKEYMRSLQVEIVGCSAFIRAINRDAYWMTLISILQYLIDNESDIPTVRREVFKAISICNKLIRKYSEGA